jgi:hypothetical protein
MNSITEQQMIQKLQAQKEAKLIAEYQQMVIEGKAKDADDAEQAYFAFIPASVRNSGLTANEMLLYADITALTKQRGFCYATNKRFLKNFSGKSERTIQNWLGNLEKAGFIKRVLIYKENSKEVTARLIYLTDGVLVDNPDNDLVSDKPNANSEVKESTVNNSSQDTVQNVAQKPQDDFFMTPGEKNDTTPGEEIFTTPGEKNCADIITSLSSQLNKDIINNTSINTARGADSMEYTSRDQPIETEGNETSQGLSAEFVFDRPSSYNAADAAAFVEQSSRTFIPRSVYETLKAFGLGPAQAMIDAIYNQKKMVENFSAAALRQQDPNAKRQTIIGEQFADGLPELASKFWTHVKKRSYEQYMETGHYMSNGKILNYWRQMLTRFWQNCAVLTQLMWSPDGFAVNHYYDILGTMEEEGKTPLTKQDVYRLVFGGDLIKTGEAVRIIVKIDMDDAA